MFRSGSDSPKSYAHQPPITYGFNRAWDQPEWHIDPVNGNDRNVGDTALNPIKTAAQYHHRVGTVHEFNRQINMTIYSSLLSNDILNIASLKCTQPNNSYRFQITGIPKVIASGTAIVRNFDQLNNIQWGISCSSLGSLAQHVKLGRSIRKTTGSNSFLTSFWFAKDENGTMARVSQPSYSGNNYNQNNLGTIQTGDNFDIIDLPEIPSAVFGGQGQGINIKSLYFRSNISNPWLSGAITFRDCSFDYWLGGSDAQTATNCQVGNFLTQNAGGLGNFTYGLFLNTLISNLGRLGIQNYVLLQGCQTYVPMSALEGLGAGISCHTRGFGIYDSPGDGLVIASGQECHISGTIWGSGNAGHPLEIQRGGRLMLAQNPGPAVGGKFFVLTGGAGLSDIILAERTNGPAVAITNPYGYTNDRDYSFDNLHTPVAEGGFGLNMFDPSNPSTSIVQDLT